jgi:hypothetical protein
MPSSPGGGAGVRTAALWQTRHAAKPSSRLAVGLLQPLAGVSSCLAVYLTGGGVATLEIVCHLPVQSLRDRGCCCRELCCKFHLLLRPTCSHIPRQRLCACAGAGIGGGGGCLPPPWRAVLVYVDLPLFSSVVLCYR